MTWPAIQKPGISTPTKVIDNSLKSDLVNGMRLSRPKYTRQLREWTLTWNALSDTDLVLLLTWFDTCSGGSAGFTWSDEFNNNYTVRFNGDVTHQSVGGSHSQVTLKLEEV